MIAIRLLISMAALWCLSTATLPLKAQETLMNDVVEFECGVILERVRDLWKPAKDSVFRYYPFADRNKSNNVKFMHNLVGLSYCCCLDSSYLLKGLNSVFPKPDAVVKTDSLIKQYYFVRIKEYCNYKSKKLKLSDNIPYLIVLVFDKKTQLLKQVITN